MILRSTERMQFLLLLHVKSAGADDTPSLRKSQDASEAEQEEWEPKTREEAQQLWKKMQSTPDHLGLLHIYKRAGVEPIKVAKSVLSLPDFLLPTNIPTIESEA